MNIISELRKLPKETLNQVNDMPIVFDIADTPAYARAKAEGKAEDIAKMLSKGFTVQQVVDILEVPLESVLQVQKNKKFPALF